jgi:hypothetical protein
MEKLESVSEKLQEFREVAKDIVGNSCHGALLAKGFVPNELLIEPSKGTSFLNYIEQGLLFETF